MNIFNIVSTIIVILITLGTWLFPDAKLLPLNLKVYITIGIFIFLVILIKGKDLLERLKGVSPILQAKVSWLIEKITHPLAKALYTLILLNIVIYISNFDTRVIYLSLAILLLYFTSLKWFWVRNVSFDDTFDSGIGSWKIVSGNPSINDQFGNPAPNLDLHVVQGAKTNCFVELLPIVTPKKGSIECDVYLEPGSLFNIVFKADTVKEKWYMARLETRPGSEDAILKNNGKGWNFIKRSGANSSPSTWHRMRVELDGPEIKLYRDGKLLVEVNDSDFKNGRIGIFNEVGEVHMDNFSVINRD